VVHIPVEDISVPELEKCDIMDPESDRMIEDLFRDLAPDVKYHAERVRKIARAIAWRLKSETTRISEGSFELLDRLALLHDIGAAEKYHPAFKAALEKINYGIHHPPADRAVRHGRVEPTQICLSRWGATKAMEDKNIPEEEVLSALKQSRKTGEYYPVYRLYIKYVALRYGPEDDLTREEEVIARNIFNHGKRSVELLREKRIKVPTELELLIRYHHDYNALDRRLREMVSGGELSSEKRDILLFIATIFIAADVFEMGNNYERIVKKAGRSRVEDFGETFDIFGGFMWKRFNQTERIEDTRAIEALKELLAVETAAKDTVIIHPALERVIAEARGLRYADNSSWLTDGDRKFQGRVVEQRRKKAIEEEPFAAEYEIAIGIPLGVYNRLEEGGHMDELKDIQEVSAIIRIDSSGKGAMLRELAEKTEGAKCISALVDADIIDTGKSLTTVAAELKEIVADFAVKARRDIIRLTNPEIGELTEESVKAVKDINALKDIMRILLKVQPYSRSYRLSEKSLHQMRVENAFNSFYARKITGTGPAEYLEKAVQNLDRYYLVHYADGRQIIQNKDLAVVPPGLEIQKRRKLQNVSRLIDAYHDKFFIVAPEEDMTDQEKEDFKTRIMDLWMLDGGVVSGEDVVILDRVDEGYRTSGLYLMAEDRYEGATKTNTGFRCLTDGLEYDEIAGDLGILQLEMAPGAHSSISQYEIFVNLLISREYNTPGLQKDKEGYYTYLPEARAINLENEIKKYYDRFLKEILVKA